METLRFRLTGTSPLLLHNGRLANPLDPFARRVKEVTSKKKKTDEDYATIFRIEWEGGLYHDPQIGPFIPGVNIDASIREAARLQKRGKDVERGILTVEDRVPIEYDGPRDIEDMYPQFSYVCGVVNPGSRGRTMRCRPMFPEWALEFSVAYSPELLNPSDILHFLEQGGRFLGFCDGRPRYGKFEPKLLSNGKAKG